MTARLMRSLAAALLLAGGVVHFNLWTSGYRHIPKIGPLFLANFIVSIGLAVAVLATRRPAVALAGMMFAASSLGALGLTRTVGVLGFTETGWTTPAIKTLSTELGAILALAGALALQLRATHHLAPASNRG